MSRDTRLEFRSPPSLARSYLKALRPGRPRLLRSGTEVGPIEARLVGVRVSGETLAAYNEVCHFRPAPHLPITYPHILAAPLHMAMLTSAAFPLRLVGLVHTSHLIVQHRALARDEPLEVSCRLEGHRETERGQEFDLLSEAAQGSEVAWAETTTFLARDSTRKAPRPTSPGEPGRTQAEIRTLEVPGNTGRRYARVSGDYNPIHLSSLTARVLGFRRAIAHGMWSLARCLAEISPPGCDFARVRASFKIPLFLPAQARLQINAGTRGARFVLLDATGEKPHLEGEVERVGE